MSDATVAKLLLIALSFCWGLSWSAMRIALYEVSPWTLRFLGYSLGAVTLFIAIKAQGGSLTIPRGRHWLHVVVAALFIVVSFGVAGTFAQLMANTSRVIIVNYSMPVWGSLLAYFVLHERINARSAMGLALCVAGLAVLVYPVAEQSLQEPIGLLLALICALGWAAGTVYMKWARIQGDLLAISFWQIMVGVVAFAVGYLVFEGLPAYRPLTLANLGRNSVQRHPRHRHCLCDLVQHHRPAHHRDGLARHLDQPGGRRHRRDDLSRRPADDAGRDRLCADLRRRRLRAAAATTACRIIAALIVPCGTLNIFPMRNFCGTQTRPTLARYLLVREGKP